MLLVIAIAAIVAGGIAAVSGFGIGSVLTPAMTNLVPVKLAVAAVSIPHFVGSAYRFWLIRKHVDLQLLRSFGLTSAIGALAGAIVNHFVVSRALEIVLAILLLFVGVGGYFGWTKRMRFLRSGAWIAGGLSGFLGGLVGNQGGLRAGAMTGLGVSRDAFVATATATGLIVDGARLPVYVIGQWDALGRIWWQILLLTFCVIAGTLGGMAVLPKIPEAAYLRLVSALLVGLGIWLLVKR